MEKDLTNAGEGRIFEKAHACRRQAIVKKNCHYHMANRAEALHVKLGFFVTMLSTIVGTLLLATLTREHKNDTWYMISIITGVISVFAALLSGLQTYFRLIGTAENNRTQALRYEAIYAKIESLFLTHRGTLAENGSNDVMEKLTEIFSDFEKASEIAPLIPNAILEKCTTLYEALPYNTIIKM